MNRKKNDPWRKKIEERKNQVYEKYKNLKAKGGWFSNNMMDMLKELKDCEKPQNKEEEYWNLGVKELKNLLRDQGKKVSGSKTQLIDRLMGRNETPTKKKKRKRTTAQKIGDDDEAPTKKKRKKVYRGFDGVEKEDFDNMKPKNVKKELKGMVKTLHRMVDRDWHDGYEEQEEYISNDYYVKVTEICQSLYNASILTDLPKEAYIRINESLRLICDSWNEMGSIPKRGDVSETDMDHEIEMTEIDITKNFTDLTWMVGVVWKIALCSSICSDEFSDEELYRYLKNFRDCIGEDVDMENVMEQDEIDEHQCVRDGIEKLNELWENKNNWKDLRSEMKNYKTKRVIDRRFSGAKELRTRDFGDDGDGCLIC